MQKIGTGDKKSGKLNTEGFSSSKIPSKRSELFKYFLERHSEFVSEKEKSKSTGGE